MKHYTCSNSFDTTLVRELYKVPDKRSDQGKRHHIGLILSTVFLGFLKGKTSIEACCDFANYHISWFEKCVGKLPHGIPDPTTVSRALAAIEPIELIRAINRYFDKLICKLEKVASLDGKTIRAIHKKEQECICHMLSLFTSLGIIRDQEGVKSKENEITAAPRLLKRQTLFGATVTADALLTQKKITKAIIKDSRADYLLPVKDNHPDLQEIIGPTLSDPLSKLSVYSRTESRKTRQIITTVTLTDSFDQQALRQEGWIGISLVGSLQRKGTRTHKGTESQIDETIYLIASNPNLTPKQALEINRTHWGIENKLHWQKDYTFGEDRQKAKTKHLPTILSYLRSVAVSLIRQYSQSVTKAINQFNEQFFTYEQMLTQLHIM